ncbi:hypothetical protein GCM10027262_30820 [Nocardia tengchongensis]
MTTSDLPSACAGSVSAPATGAVRPLNSAAPPKTIATAERKRLMILGISCGSEWDARYGSPDPSVARTGRVAV